MKIMKLIGAVFSLLFLTTFTLFASETMMPAGSGKDGPGKGYLSSEKSCFKCHKDSHASYLESSHAYSTNPKAPANTHACQSCHGPGEAHARSLGEVPIYFSPSAKNLKAKEINAICMECHQTGETKLWHGSKHQREGNSCLDCHNTHGGNYKNLKQGTISDNCKSCHKEVYSDLNKSSHHPIKEGKVSCTDCHNPHGTVNEGLMKGFSINQTCYSCHAEKRGPFLWQHIPTTEACTTCHVPHGSSHARLLKTKAPFLCQKCHDNQYHPSDARGASVAGQGSAFTEAKQLYGRACMNCHIQVHGSNHPAGKALMR